MVFSEKIKNFYINFRKFIMFLSFLRFWNNLITEIYLVTTVCFVNFHRINYSCDKVYKSVRSMGLMADIIFVNAYNMNQVAMTGIFNDKN